MKTHALGAFGVDSMTQPAGSAASATTKGAFDDSKDFVDTANDAFGSPAPASPLDHSAKQLNFDGKAAPGTPVTPVLSTSKPAQVEDDEGGEVDYNAFIRDTLLWTNHVRSGLYLASGAVVILLAHRLATSHLSLVTGVCYILLAQLALNFARYLSSPQLQAKCTWGDSAWTYAAISSLGNTLKAAAAVHDAHFMGVDAVKTMKIGALLWVVSLGARTLTTTQLAMVLWLAAFTLPKAYTLQKAKIDDVVAQVTTQVKGVVGKVDVRVMGGALALLVLGAGYLLSRLDLVIALFLLAVYGRTLLGPKGLATLDARVVKPLTATTTKMSGTVSRLVGQAAAKYDLTPTPTKAKRE